MPQEFECPECGNAYDSERGLHIHIGQKHKDRKEEILAEEKAKKEGEFFEVSIIPTSGKIALFIVIALLLLGAVFFVTQGGFQMPEKEELTASQAGDRVETFLSNVPQLQGADVSVAASDTESGVYRMDVEISGPRGAQNVTNYLTKDGELLFPSAQTAEAEPDLTPQEAGQKAAETLNGLKQVQLSNMTVSFSEYLGEQSSVYSIKLTISGPRGDQSLNSYVTKDGKYVFSNAVNLTEQMNAVGGQQETQTPKEQKTTKKNVSVDDDPVKGSENAPVTIIEFSDFECPYCGKFYRQALQKIEENYIQTGKVKLVYRDFPLTNIHDNAQKAAEAAECADDQGKFWKYHDKLFENQNSFGVSSLKQYAKDLGLDTQKFNDCLDSDKYKQEVQDDLQDGRQAGVTGTPAFFINGKMLRGAQPYSEFKQIIEQELA